jgi:hypothetical protein
MQTNRGTNMIDSSVFMRGSIRHMFRIGQSEEHKALRQRNEERLAKLKQDGKLVEDKKDTIQ